MKQLKYSAVGLAAIFVLSSCQPRSSKESDTEILSEAWEYKEFRSPTQFFPKDELNQLGGEGWELVTVFDDGTNTPLFTLKRRLATTK